MGNAIAMDNGRQPSGESRGNALQAAQREATRDRLVEGAIRVFTRKGYAASVVADVLKEAQVSRASFYAHFSSMQALVEEIADRFAPVWQPYYAQLARMPGKTREQLRDWCGQMVRFYRENEAICVILAHAVLLDQEIYGKTARYQEVLIDLLADGEPRLAHLREDADARMRVGRTYETAEGLVFLGRVVDEPSAAAQKRVVLSPQAPRRHPSNARPIRPSVPTITRHHTNRPKPCLAT